MTSGAPEYHPNMMLRPFLSHVVTVVVTVTGITRMPVHELRMF